MHAWSLVKPTERGSGANPLSQLIGGDSVFIMILISTQYPATPTCKPCFEKLQDKSSVILLAGTFLYVEHSQASGPRVQAPQGQP